MCHNTLCVFRRCAYCLLFRSVRFCIVSYFYCSFFIPFPRTRRRGDGQSHKTRTEINRGENVKTKDEDGKLNDNEAGIERRRQQWRRQQKKTRAKSLLFTTQSAALNISGTAHKIVASKMLPINQIKSFSRFAFNFFFNENNNKESVKTAITVFGFIYTDQR